MSVLIGNPFVDDTLTGDNGADNTIFGDAQDFLSESGEGGDDVLTGGDNASNTLFGDAGGIAIISATGDDVLIGGANSTNLLFGDVGGDLINVGGGESPGADRLTGGDHSTNTLVGDARDGSGPGKTGGDDVLTGGADSTNILVGDALDGIAPSGRNQDPSSGDDTIIGGANSINTIAGDTLGDAFGGVGGALGNDVAIGGEGGTNTIFGDAAGRFGFQTGASDRLFGGANSVNTLVGDADVLDSDSIGGDDLLVSGNGTDDMWGDARQVLGFAVGGRDIFRFLADNGNDTIHDFERGKDLIEVSAALLPVANAEIAAPAGSLAALAQFSLGKLTIEERDANDDGTTDSIIHFDAENSVTVLGVTGLTSEDIVAAPGTSYVLFGRTSLPNGTRVKWVGSEANSLPSDTPGSSVSRSAFDADTATGAGTVLAGPGFADYAVDGILLNANVAMFDLTELPLGVFATGAPAELEAKIAANAPFFGTAKTDLDPANSDIDLSASKLHLAQTDGDWNGIKNLEISLDSDTSFRDIHLANFVDMRLKIGDLDPEPSIPQGAVFDVQLLGAKRGEVDASHAPQAIDLLLAVWTNTGTSQNSFDIKGSVFDDTVTIRPGQVIDSEFGQSEGWYAAPFFGAGSEGIYLGLFTTVFANLGAGDDQFDSELALGHGNRDGSPFFVSQDVVWGGTDDDVIVTGDGADRLFGDNGSDAWLNRAPFLERTIAGNDHLSAGNGADWIEGNGDTGVVRLVQDNLIVNGSFEEFDRTPDADTISHQGGKWFTLNETIDDDGNEIDNVPGWENFVGPIELQTNAVGGLAAFDGLIKLELDSHPDFGLTSFTSLVQDVGFDPRLDYHFSFAYAPRPGAPAGSSAFEVNFANLALSFPNDDPGWHIFEADVDTGGGGRLNFLPSGPLDSLGAFIDDVRLTHEPTLDLSLAGDIIDCGIVAVTLEPTFGPDFSRDTINFNAGDGFDVVHNFGAGIFTTDGGFSIENVDDVLRIENVGVLTTEVVFSDQGHGTLVQNGAGSVFLVGVTVPLAQSTDGKYLLLFDAS